jgi:hypothetical protein
VVQDGLRDWKVDRLASGDSTRFEPSRLSIPMNL